MRFLNEKESEVGNSLENSTSIIIGTSLTHLEVVSNHFVVGYFHCIQILDNVADP